MDLPGSLVAKASKDRRDDKVGIVRHFYKDGRNTRLFYRVVVPSWKQRIADVDHLFQGNVESFTQLSYAIGFVDARLGHID